MKDFRRNFKYTWEHKKAFLKVEKILRGKNTLRGYLHDTDKLFLYLFFDKKKVHKIHRNKSRHHTIKARTKEDYIQMAIDWECARITKPDKPMNAYETLYALYPEIEDQMLEAFKTLKITDKHIDYDQLYDIMY